MGGHTLWQLVNPKKTSDVRPRRSLVLNGCEAWSTSAKSRSGWGAATTWTRSSAVSDGLASRVSSARIDCPKKSATAPAAANTIPRSSCNAPPCSCRLRGVRQRCDSRGDLASRGARPLPRTVIEKERARVVPIGRSFPTSMGYRAARQRLRARAWKVTKIATVARKRRAAAGANEPCARAAHYVQFTDCSVGSGSVLPLTPTHQAEISPWIRLRRALASSPATAAAGSAAPARSA